MKITDKLTTDLIVMYINIPTDDGMEHYVVNILCPDMNKDVYSVTIYNLDTDGQDLYSRFEVNSLYEIISDRELDKREDAILLFIANRLRLD